MIEHDYKCRVSECQRCYDYDAGRAYQRTRHQRIVKDSVEQLLVEVGSLAVAFGLKVERIDNDDSDSDPR